eukprot:CAMPEP_0196579654 /NCGR_PEP_ID=MMETSP1081-20130531/24128_1 /TAXON_ID=36882 /ORGANISM="Pyramimonas amylifera, Strain CCMP720" /LENGTH=641 /DNA_ID=CAMNT_0041899301 /DNA_START=293 /DNA_END=2218 /DNA_ORIENTATION=-
MDDYLVLAGTIALGMSGVAALVYQLTGSRQPVQSPEAILKAKKANNKKKKKKAAAAVEPEPESESEIEPLPVSIPIVEPEFKTGKKKKTKKSKVEEPEPVVAPAPVQPTPAPETQEEQWEEMKTSKAKKKSEKKLEKKAAALAAAPVSVAKVSAETAAPVPIADPIPPPRPSEEWTTVPKRGFKKEAKMWTGESVNELEVEEEDDGSLLLDLGDSLGTVIGRAGANIRQITVESGARLDIEKGTTLCRISGLPDSIRKAAGMVQHILDKRAEELSNLRSLVITVGSKAPALLGKGGSNIRWITNESGARLDVSCEEGIVTISGTKEQISIAEEMVKVSIHGEASECIELGQRGMYVIKGTGGATIRRLQDETGARFDLDMAAKTLVVSGPKEAVSRAAVLVRQTLNDHSCEFDVQVDEVDIGAVVGKGGVNIKQLQLASGATVEIQRGLPNQTCQVKLLGTLQQVEAAKILVDKAVAREPELKAGEIMETLELGGAVGLVIGASGASVKQLQEETGAKVDILRGSGTCKVFGSKEAVALAKAKILEKVSAFTEREAKLCAAAAATVVTRQQDVQNGGWEPALAPVPGAGSTAPWEAATIPWEAAEPPIASSNWGTVDNSPAWNTEGSGHSDWPDLTNPDPW